MVVGPTEVVLVIRDGQRLHHDVVDVVVVVRDVVGDVARGNVGWAVVTSRLHQLSHI